MSERAFLFGFWLDSDAPQIDPVEIATGETAIAATRRAIAAHGDAGDYQYVATISVDHTGVVLCTADDLVAGGPVNGTASGVRPAPGRAIVVGYFESTGEADTVSKPVASRDQAETLTRETVARRRRHGGDYLYLGTIFDLGRASVSFTVENLADSDLRRK